MIKLLRSGQTMELSSFLQKNYKILGFEPSKNVANLARRKKLNVISIFSIIKMYQKLNQLKIKLI